MNITHEHYKYIIESDTGRTYTKKGAIGASAVAIVACTAIGIAVLALLAHHGLDLKHFHALGNVPDLCTGIVIGIGGVGFLFSMRYFLKKLIDHVQHHRIMNETQRLGVLREAFDKMKAVPLEGKKFRFSAMTSEKLLFCIKEQGENERIIFTYPKNQEIGWLAKQAELQNRSGLRCQPGQIVNPVYVTANFFTKKQALVVGTVTAVALAAIGIGILAFWAVTGKDVGMFHALSGMTNFGSAVSIWWGTGLLMPCAVYLGYKLVQHIRTISQKNKMRILWHQVAKDYKQDIQKIWQELEKSQLQNRGGNFCYWQPGPEEAPNGIFQLIFVIDTHSKKYLYVFLPEDDSGLKFLESLAEKDYTMQPPPLSEPPPEARPDMQNIHYKLEGTRIVPLEKPESE